MNIIRQALKKYSDDSNTRLILIFAIVGLVAAGLSVLFYFLVGQNHPGTVLAYLLPLIFLVLGVAAIIVARLIDDPYAGLGYIALALFLLFAALASFIVTLILVL